MKKKVTTEDVTSLEDELQEMNLQKKDIQESTSNPPDLEVLETCQEEEEDEENIDFEEEDMEEEDSEGIDFWMPPAGMRWDDDDGSHRWGEEEKSTIEVEEGKKKGKKEAKEKKENGNEEKREKKNKKEKMVKKDKKEEKKEKKKTEVLNEEKNEAIKTESGKKGGKKKEIIPKGKLRRLFLFKFIFQYSTSISLLIFLVENGDVTSSDEEDFFGRR